MKSIVGVISGYKGSETKEFIDTIKEIWEKHGKKERGAQDRYQLIIGRMNKRAALVPTVSTRKGTETIIIWNLTQDNMKQIEQEATGAGIPVKIRKYIWFDAVPASLPDEQR